jgi:hypothetical protein
MSAARLREAAALMRSRAEAVRTGADEPDMWFGADEIVDEFMWGDQPQHGDVKADAEHIASWHPVVALAVADLLDMAATHQVGFTPVARERILAVVDAYLADTN